jgi:hypothetical protein
MAMKQGQAGIVGNEIDFDMTETFYKNRVFEDPGLLFSVDFRDLEIMLVQMQRMEVVALVGKVEPSKNCRRVN